MRNFTAIVPMRHSSERIVGKNLRTFAGKPLYHHIIKVLRAVDAVTRIVIDTDSDTIAQDAARAFPDVVLLDRPKALGEGHVTMNAVLANTLPQLAGECFLQTHSTNPLLLATTISSAIAAFGSDHEADSLLSVTRLNIRLWTDDGPLNHDPQNLIPTQDLAPLYEENSCLYLFTRSGFDEQANRVGKNPLLFEIDALEAADIDIPSDFILAEQLFLLRR